ncbi:MAG: MFS transporter [Deltaproteobacteria bacterium]|nr:MFS transporter [Deltaproteobacteria bacterium]
MAPPRFARNLAAVLLWEGLWGFGNACTVSAIFNPFLSQLEGSKKLVGTVGLTMLLGIPALFVSLWLGHRLRRRKLVVTALWVAQCLGWIVLGAVLTSGTTPTRDTIVPVVYVTQAVFAFVAAVSMAPTYQLLANAFGDRFATAQGLQLLFRQIAGVLGGLWAATALAASPFPRNYGVTFLAGGIVLTVSNFAVLLFVEDEQTEEERKAREDRAHGFVPSLGKTLGAARPIAGFFWVIAAVSWSVSAQGLLTVSALERLHLSDAHAGVFASVTLAASGIGGAISGRTGDRIGHHKALLFALAAQAASFVLVIGLASLAQFYVALVLAGVANAAMQVGLAGLTTKLAPQGDKGAFMAIMRWIFQIVMAVATAATAFLSDRVGYGAMFTSCLVPVVAATFFVRRIGAVQRAA